MGVVDPSRPDALIPFPNGKTKLIGTGHSASRMAAAIRTSSARNAASLRSVLYLIDDAPRCFDCCDAMGIRHASKWGFGRDERRRASDLQLDQLIAKLETTEPLSLKPAPASWRAGQGSSTTGER